MSATIILIMTSSSTRRTERPFGIRADISEFTEKFTVAPPKGHHGDFSRTRFDQRTGLVERRPDCCSVWRSRHSFRRTAIHRLGLISSLTVVMSSMAE
jgi:hypothetical protein